MKERLQTGRDGEKDQTGEECIMSIVHVLIETIYIRRHCICSPIIA